MTHRCACCGEPCDCTPVEDRCEVCARCWKEKRIVLVDERDDDHISPGRPWELDDDA